MKTHAFAAKSAQKKTVLGFNIHFLTFLVVTPLVFVVWYLTDTSYPWPVWSTTAWAVGVIFHYLGVFVFKNKKLNAYRDGNN